MRYRDWKLVQYLAPKKQDPDRGPTWRLYNLTEDLGERNDLAEQYPNVVKTILALLRRDGLL